MPTSSVNENPVASPTDAPMNDMEMPAFNGASRDGASRDGAAQPSAVEVAAPEAPGADAPSADAPSADAEAGTLDEAVDETPVEDEATHPDVSLEIDHRRARQLLDRALTLSERGDLAGAILAARQAVALTPNSPAGHSMLGFLHERAGDLEKAIADYEKVLQLAPNSTLERDSLERLKATLEQENASVIFHFDDTELFEEPETLPTVLPAAQPAPPAQSAKAAPAAPVTATRSASPASAAPVAATPVVAPSATAAAPAKRVAVSAPGIGALDVAAPSRPSLLRRLAKQPSFYFKSAPLVATTALGLLFMAWAQGIQQRRFAESPTTFGNPPATEGGTTTTETVPTPVPATPGGVSPTLPPPGTVPAGTGVFGPPKPGAAGPGKAVIVRPSAATTRTTPRVAPRLSTASRPMPALAPPVIPQPAVGAGGTTTGGATNGGATTTVPFGGLRPITPRGETAPAVRPAAPSAAAPAPVSPIAPPASAPLVNPGDGGGSSRGGAPFTPGNQPKGAIQIAPVRPAFATAPRPANVARRNEADAARAAASGNTGAAAQRMTESIQRLPTGYAYQRRAMAFLEQGDYGRAADDFQSAIAVYEDQIRHGQDVEDARNGQRACRSGLQMAMSAMRR